MKLSPRIIALALPFVMSCATDDGPTAVQTSSLPLFDVNAPLPFVYDVENTGAWFAPPGFPAFDQMVSEKILPDPFRSFNGGAADLSFANWSRRRAEMKASIENFEIGPKPDAADVDVAATFGADSNLTVVVTRRSNQRSITFKTKIYLPAGSGPFPAIIGMAWFGGNGTGSLPVDIFTSRNIARLNYLHDQATTYIDFTGKGHGNDPYFYLYPEYNVGNGNVGQYSAWAWGVSRLIDGIQIAAGNGTLPIDTRHLAVTGCSYAGKMALYAGALDERVALTIAQESGGGGAPAWRVSHGIEPNGSVEKIDNTNYTWFMQGMRAFSADNVYKLPHDHHELMAMVAPRALLVTGNTNYTWLSNRSAYVSARAAQETYKQLGIADRFGYFIDGGHNHCAIPTSQRPAIEAFVDKFLLGQSVITDVQVHPFGATIDVDAWMPWALRSDIAALVAAGTLSADQGAGLSDKLSAALESIATGRITPALNQLKAFNNQVNAFMNSGALTAEQGAVLTTKVNAAAAQIGA